VKGLFYVGLRLRASNADRRELAHAADARMRLFTDRIRRMLPRLEGSAPIEIEIVDRGVLDELAHVTDPVLSGIIRRDLASGSGPDAVILLVDEPARIRTRKTERSEQEIQQFYADARAAMQRFGDAFSTCEITLDGADAAEVASRCRRELVRHFDGRDVA
jgi:hypothetical protein